MKIGDVVTRRSSLPIVSSLVCGVVTEIIHHPDDGEPVSVQESLSISDAITIRLPDGSEHVNYVHNCVVVGSPSTSVDNQPTPAVTRTGAGPWLI